MFEIFQIHPLYIPPVPYIQDYLIVLNNLAVNNGISSIFTLFPPLFDPLRPIDGRCARKWLTQPPSQLDAAIVYSYPSFYYYTYAYYLYIYIHPQYINLLYIYCIYIPSSAF